MFLTQYRQDGDVGVPAILQYRPPDLYLTDRKKLWQFCKKVPTHLSTFANKDFPPSSFSLTR